MPLTIIGTQISNLGSVCPLLYQHLTESVQVQRCASRDEHALVPFSAFSSQAPDEFAMARFWRGAFYLAADTAPI